VKRRWGIVVVGIVVALSAACTGGGGVNVEHGGELETRIGELSAEGGSADLAQLTDGTEWDTWDTVHVFVEGTPASEIEDLVGEPVISGNYYYDAGNLLVFVKDDQPVAAVSVVPDLLITGGQTTWGAETRLEPATPTRPAGLRLVEP
jgi:hypothetical protein